MNRLEAIEARLAALKMEECGAFWAWGGPAGGLDTSTEVVLFESVSGHTLPMFRSGNDGYATDVLKDYARFIADSPEAVRDLLAVAKEAHQVCRRCRLKHCRPACKFLAVSVRMESLLQEVPS